MNFGKKYRPFLTKRGVVFLPEKNSLIYLKAIFKNKNKNRNSSVILDKVKNIIQYPITDKTPELFNYPPLPNQLSKKEIDLLTQDNDTVFSNTMFGSERYIDKPTNEDFALSADIKGIKFCVVADGVSTGTFYSDRASRIAGITTFQVMKDILKGPVDLSDREQQQNITNKILSAIHANYFKDREVLLEENSIPLTKKISEEEYLKKINYPLKWYQTTFIFCVAGKSGGFLVVIGDGGAMLARYKDNQLTKKTTLLSSEGNEPLDNILTLKSETMGRKITDISGVLENNERVDVYISSDGIDGSFFINNLSYEDVKIDSIQDIELLMRELSNDSLPNEREVDNYALAKIVWGARKKVPKKLNLYENELIPLRNITAEIDTKLDTYYFQNMVMSTAIKTLFKDMVTIGKTIGELSGTEPALLDKKERERLAKIKKIEQDFQQDIKQREQWLNQEMDDAN